uniref:Thioredoxin domain-containing protein n=1 Tax=Caenorhabditis tropicalis TaxID=1561998 RepID=A0A1I7UY31_9PELO
MLRWLALLLLHPAYLSADVVSLSSQNFEQVIQANELVFVNFYADWCRFSQMLKPIFLEASNNFKNSASGKIVWASVDADKNNDVATKYHVNKYPTLKLFRNGEVTKKEYRSSRSVEALTAYINKQMEVTVQKFTEKNALQSAHNPEKNSFIGYFNDENSVEFKNLMNVALFYRDECEFLVGIGELNFPGEVPPAGQQPKLVFQPSNKAVDPAQVPFSGDFATYEYLKQWVADKCVPLVREITFQNAEELTEEGLPFMILFKKADDKNSEKVYTDAIVREIPDQRKAINCLVGDGTLFKHPLSHLGKSESDLPVIAIDSFRHMYLFKNFEDIHVPGKLRQFVLDLHSGKLHREFHHGPDPVTFQTGNQTPDTEPPPSTFEKLKPASSRYTILDKTEL